MDVGLTPHLVDASGNKKSLAMDSMIGVDGKGVFVFKDLDVGDQAFQSGYSLVLEIDPSKLKTRETVSA